MSDTPTRFPLAWPLGRPRTKYPKTGKFSYKAEEQNGYRPSRDITVARAMERLEEEVSRLGGVNTLLSSNLDLRLDGRPRSDRGEPADPGVCLYFTLKGKPLAMACDAYTRVAQNIAALAAHLEATRAIERHGVATAAETLQAFQALPPPAVIQLPSRKPWREVLGFEANWPPAGTSPADVNETLKRRFRAKSIEARSDAEQMELNIARDQALLEALP